MKTSIFKLPFSISIFHFLFTMCALLFSTWLMFHTFSYDLISSTMDIAGKCWSDFGAHIPLIRSFSLGGNVDRIIQFRLPEYPIFPGEPIRYHFIFYMIVGLLEKIGFRIDWALNIPSIIGFAGLLILIFKLTQTLFKSPNSTQNSELGTRYLLPLLSVLFFLFNGSLSFLKFFEKNPLSSHTVLDIVTNRTFPSFGPWDRGLVSAFWNLNIYTNQRHLAAGFALGLLFIALLFLLERKSWKKQLPYLTISVPLLVILPFFHQPMLLILGLFMIWYVLVWKKIRVFLLFTGLLAVGPILLQLHALGDGTSTISWYPGYLIHENVTLTSFLTYWLHNLGLHLILIPIGFVIVPVRVKKTVFPVFILFLIANCFKFSVEIAANHKFFNFFMIFGNMLSAYVIVQLWNLLNKQTEECRGSKQNFARLHLIWHRESMEEKKLATEDASKFSFATKAFRIFFHPMRFYRLIILSSFCLIVFFLTLSGIIDFFAIYNDQKIPVIDIPRNEMALWVKQNTPKNAVFLNSSYLYNPISLAGRSIFLGWPYFPWSAGYKENRMAIMDTMYESKNPTVFCPLLAKYRISYVEVEHIDNDPDLPTIDPAYFKSIDDPEFLTENSRYALYGTGSLCKKSTQ